jgi:hypothetical protein
MARIKDLGGYFSDLLYAMRRILQKFLVSRDSLMLQYGNGMINEETSKEAAGKRLLRRRFLGRKLLQGGY